MDPLDFLEVADTLKDSSKEAERRTSVSRAYYAVYHYIKAYLSKNHISVPSLGHEKLIRYIKNSEIEQAKELSKMVDDLRRERINADYKIHLRSIDKKSCIFLYLKAQKAIQEFRNCKGRPLIDGINNYRRRIGEA